MLSSVIVVELLLNLNMGWRYKFVGRGEMFMKVKQHDPLQTGKRFFGFVLAFWILLSSRPSLGDQSGDWVYTSDGSNVTIKGYKGVVGDVIVPDSISNLPVTAVAGAAFANNGSLASVKLSSNTVNIGEYAFWCCTGLVSVTLPIAVTNIGRKAFEGCGNLTNINIGSAVPIIGAWAFAECWCITAFDVDAGNIGYNSVDGVLFNKDLTVLLVCPPGKTGKYSLPDGVVRIQETAFSSCRLTSVMIPDSVGEIGQYAFGGCQRLTNGIVLNNITNLGQGAFYNCSGIPDIILGRGLRTINESTFEFCSSLTNVIIPAGVTNIDDYAFCGCNSLKHVIIPRGVTRIGICAFNNCGMTSIIVPESVTSIDGYAFESCCNLKEAIFQGDAPIGNSTLFNYSEGVVVYYFPWTAGWTSTYGGRPAEENMAYSQWRLKYGIAWHDDASDPDHDGMVNWQEYLAGTSPANEDDRLLITAVAGPSTLLWLAKSNVTYQVVKSMDLITWSNSSSGMGANQQSFQTAPADGVMQYADPDNFWATNAFYRVNVVP